MMETNIKNNLCVSQSASDLVVYNNGELELNICSVVIDYIEQSIGFKLTEKLNKILKIISGLSRYYKGKANAK